MSGISALGCRVWGLGFMGVLGVQGNCSLDRTVVISYLEDPSKVDINMHIWVYGLSLYKGAMFGS